jgi:hypothetical protein
MVDMFASTGELELAVLGLASLLPPTKILEAIAAFSLAQNRVVALAPHRGPTSFPRMAFLSISVGVDRK